MDKILTIIIPTYNMEKYLDRCLSSLIVSDENMMKMEVLVINDGSKDRSSEIAHSYETRYPETFRVIDKDNGNYGSCVNRGLKEATGKYVKILDADDWFDTDGLCAFINELNTIDADIIVTGYTKVFFDGRKTVKYMSDFQYKKEVIGYDSPKLMNVDFKDFVMHSIAIRLNHLKSINYVQTEGISYTDTEYVYYPMINADTIIFLNILVYNYFIGREGQTVSIASQAKHSYDKYRIVSRMINETSEIEKDSFRKRLQTELLKWICSSYYWSVLVIQKLTQENRDMLCSIDKQICLRFPLMQKVLDKERCLGLKYIKVWHKWHIQPINHHLYIFLRLISVRY